MQFPDRRLERPLDAPQAPSENRQDVIPPTERSQDPERSTRDLVNESARPLTDEERKAADHDDAVVGQRVYAPASERVPRTVDGYGDVVDHTDMATPERAASAREMPSMTGSEPMDQTPPRTNSEPNFTRVPRPNGSADPLEAEASPERWMSNMSSGSSVPMQLGWGAVAVCGGVGIWLWLRWQRERNKPINRLRRQARHALDSAYEMRERMPEIPDEASRPAIGLGTALVSLALIVWQQSRSRSRLEPARGQAMKRGRRAARTISDMDWQQRLMQLREMWAPRLELERVSIPKSMKTKR